MALVELGVPWDVAMDMNDTWAIALLVASGESKGQTFNWETLRWIERR
jgi:hypothetical protein